MSILQLSAFDIATSTPWQLMSTTGFWASLPRLSPGLATARLWMIADTLHLDDVRAGFEAVAIPTEELPPGIRVYRQRYDDFIEQVVEDVRHIRLYLMMDSRLDDEALCDVLGSYGVVARALDHEIPLPFLKAEDRWSNVVCDKGQYWGILHSRPVQYGMLYPRSLHRLYQLDFPVWACLNVYTYTDKEAQKLLRLKAATARYGPRRTSEEAAEATEIDSTIGRLRSEMNRVGGLLHTVRLYVAIGGKDQQEMNSRLEVVRSAVPLEMGVAIPAGETLRKVFGVGQFAEPEASPLTSPGVALLAGSALSYRRRTETEGVLLGIDRNQAPVIVNIFGRDTSSFNMSVVGQTGSGKTFAILLLMLRHLQLGTRLVIVDPQGNIDLSFLGPDVCHRSLLGTQSAAINILDITQDEISTQIESVCAMLGLLGVFRRGDALGRQLLDRVLLDIYRPIWDRDVPPPTLGAVKTRLEMLAADEKLPAARETALALAFAMTPYTHGSYAELFNRPTTVDVTLKHPVTIYDISRLPGQALGETLRAAQLSILVADVSQNIRRLRWKGVSDPILFFVDEMGILMKDRAVANFVVNEYKTARSRGMGMIVADQTLNSLLGPRDPQTGAHHGEEILSNSLFKLLFYQDEVERQRVMANFSGLPPSYREAVFSFPRGVCLAQLPDDLLIVNIRPSSFERIVLSSQLAERERAKELSQNMLEELLYAAG